MLVGTQLNLKAKMVNNEDDEAKKKKRKKYVGINNL